MASFYFLFPPHNSLKVMNENRKREINRERQVIRRKGTNFFEKIEKTW